MDNFKQLAQEIRDENLMKEIERKHKIHLLDFSLLILTILLAIDLAALAVKLIM